MVVPADIYDLTREALVIALLLSLPVLGAALLAGLLSALMHGQKVP